MSSSRNEDSYNVLDEMTESLLMDSLESSNLIVGIDFTKKNERTGFHHIGDELNPYEHIITIIGRTLALFNEHNMIPCYGFGDASTHDQDVFSFYPYDRFCDGLEEVLSRYKEILPHLKLSGPTSFGPIIEMATTIVEQSGRRYHILLIVTCGQVTRGLGTEFGKLSPQEKRTVDAIVEASKFPLSIILVGVGDGLASSKQPSHQQPKSAAPFLGTVTGCCPEYCWVGDGPWDTVKDFYDNIPGRAFDNLQFVNSSKIMSQNKHPSQKEAEFVVAAFTKIPSQYIATVELGLYRCSGNGPQKNPLPPPIYDAPHLPESHPSEPLIPDKTPSYSELYKQLCPICMSDPKDMAFGCGHQTCCECGKNLQLCPICRRSISTKIKLYD